ncbi:MAG: hypothetical protein BWK76_10960 [Desulfobulbaceae bacterium A2]|nr:MAG: hypothetical protein BWK76_10960 [Desulfobulbaceae bacterium A2]
MMQQPSISDSVINKLALVDRKGGKLHAHNFINPSFIGLLISNHGQGVLVEWISDTQQFSITGYGKNAESASLIASCYAETFIAYEQKQFVQLLENLKERKQKTLESATSRRRQADIEQAGLRAIYKVADWTNRLESMTSSLATIERSIEDVELAEATIISQIQEYESQLKQLAQPVHRSEVEQKNSMISSLQNLLASLSQQLASASVQFTPEHPEYKKIQIQIDELQRQMVSEAKKEYSQTTRSTSDTLDSVLTSLMTARVTRAIRDSKLERLRANKEQYIQEMDFISRGSANNNDLEDEKKRLTSIIENEREDILKIESVQSKPFSFYRVTATPFIDRENLNHARYFPRRKLILLVAFAASMLLSLLYLLTKELHVETLFCSWQLNMLPKNVQAIDVSFLDKASLALAVRYIFACETEGTFLARVRRIDMLSDSKNIATKGAVYLACAGETLFIDDCLSKEPEKSVAYAQGIRAWLAGKIDNITSCIKKGEDGYDVLLESSPYSEAVWKKSTEELRALFAHIFSKYNAIVMHDQGMLQSHQRYPSDFTEADVDVMTVQAGLMSVECVEKLVRQEKQIYKSTRTVLVVINDHVVANVFTLSGLGAMFRRFLIMPVDALRMIRKAVR